MSDYDLFPYAKPLPKGHVYVTTQRDVICPAEHLTQQGWRRCVRGVGHQGQCQHGRNHWGMTVDERRLTDCRVDVLARELGWVPRTPSPKLDHAMSRPHLSKEERHVLEAINGLQKSGMPAVPFAIAIRAGMNVDHCSMVLEGLRRKGALEDINNPGGPR